MNYDLNKASDWWYMLWGIEMTGAAAFLACSCVLALPKVYARDPKRQNMRHASHCGTPRFQADERAQC